jgi:hypothetical protein
MASAVVVADDDQAKRSQTIGGEAIVIPPKVMGRGYPYWIGGGIFGVGWALTGACPGPLFALVGNGVSVIAVLIVSAVAGTWTYGGCLTERILQEINR